MAASKRMSALLWKSALLLLMVGTASAAADDYPSQDRGAVRRLSLLKFPQA
jgi:hypothetical protein